MRALRLAAVAATLVGLGAGRAEAAAFSEDFNLEAGTAAAYVFTFSDSFTGAAVFSAFGYTIRYTPWFPPSFYDYYSETLFAACLLPAACEASAVEPGGSSISLLLAPMSSGFVLYAQNRNLDYVDCRSPKFDFAPCGSSFHKAYLTVSGDTVGTYGVTVTPMGVPEPAAWAMMIAGFGLVGASLRRARETEMCAAG
jgi:hypothetical protein